MLYLPPLLLQMNMFLHIVYQPVTYHIWKIIMIFLQINLNSNLIDNRQSDPLNSLGQPLTVTDLPTH